MHRRFDALLKTYEQFAELVLHTIRVDIRCRVIHYLDQAVRHVSDDSLIINSSRSIFFKGNYRIDREVGEPDPRIVELNSDLSNCDEAISSALPERERKRDRDLAFPDGYVTPFSVIIIKRVKKTNLSRPSLSLSLAIADVACGITQKSRRENCCVRKRNARNANG